MQIAIEISQLISTAALVATLAVVVWYTVKTSQMAAATRDMAQVSQQQRYDQQRPLLIPHGTPALQDDKPNWLNWQAKDQDITLRNVGIGPALNVACVLYGCESYDTSPVGTPVVRSDDMKDTHWTGWLGMPIAPNEAMPADLRIGRSIFFEDRKQIGSHSFNAPPQPTLGEIMYGNASMRLARMMITCVDVFGRKHASVFDYVQHINGWQLVEFLPDVAEDLHDLAGAS